MDEVTVAQAAKSLRRSRQYVARLCRDGVIPSRRVGPIYLIRVDDLRKFSPRPPGRPPQAKV